MKRALQALCNRRLVGALVMSALCGAAASAACANPVDDRVVLGTPDAEPNPEPEKPSPVFTSPDPGPDADTDASIPEPEKILACIGTECPYPYATCPSDTGTDDYKCGINLLTDSNNCGACGNVCPARAVFGTLNMATRCVDGKCERECANPNNYFDYRDCNGRVDDGCEIEVKTDLDNCGACGHKCPAGTDTCADGNCGCPAGLTYCGCSGPFPANCTLGAQCLDVTSDSNNCGACGRKCKAPADAGAPPANMEYGCVASQCEQLRCKKGFADCDGKEENGCEVNLATDASNCGQCGTKCGPGQVCLKPGSDPPACGCDTGETLCGNACTDLLKDPYNCGVCGHTCPGSILSKNHGFLTCNQGFCGYGCEDGWADCDSNPVNGCETNLMVNAGNCGACGNRCDTAAGQPCIRGECLRVECDAGVVTK